MAKEIHIRYELNERMKRILRNNIKCHELEEAKLKDEVCRKRLERKE